MDIGLEGKDIVDVAKIDLGARLQGAVYSNLGLETQLVDVGNSGEVSSDDQE